LKYGFVTAFLNVGLSVAKQSNRRDVRQLISALHPVWIPLIRLGISGDGGYLLPNDLDDIDACFSPGVNNRVSFEEELVRRGIPCHLADAVFDSLTLDRLSGTNSSKSSFTPKFVGVLNDEKTITMDDWIDQRAPGDSDLLLQMDIEGHEWPVLLNVREATLRRFRIIVLETHDMERIMDKHAFLIISSVFRRLLQYFYVVHIHPNNYGGTVSCGSLEIPRSLELTFYRRDRAASPQFATTFPHPLDVKNDPRPEIDGVGGKGDARHAGEGFIVGTIREGSKPESASAPTHDGDLDRQRWRLLRRRDRRAHTSYTVNYRGERPDRERLLLQSPVQPSGEGVGDRCARR
jgi:Methyltransferase FkbM domain